MKTITNNLVALLIGALLVSTAHLPAATRIKADNADALNLTSSWTTGIVPAGADVAQFDTTVTGPLSLSLGADTAWSQINFLNPGGDLAINAGNTLTLSNANPILFGATTTNFTLNCDVKFAASTFTTVRSPAGQTLTFGGTIDGRDATVTLGNSAGTIRLSNPNTIRIGSVVQVTTAGMRLGLGASSVGEPIVSGPLGTNLFTWGASSLTSELFTYNGDQTLANPVRIQASPMNFDSTDDLTLTGVLDLNNGNRTINVADVGKLAFTGTLSNSTGLTKTGPGLLEVGGTNVAVFGGGLSIFGGTVRLLTNEWIPHGSSAGTLRMTNVTEVLDLNGFSETVRGMAGAGGSGSWNGTVDNTAPGTTSALSLGDIFTYTLAGNLQNSGLNSKLALVNVGSGGLILTNAKTFSGGLTNTTSSEIYINSEGAGGTGPWVMAGTESELVYSGGGNGLWTNEIILAAGTAPVISAADGNTLEIAGVISGPGTFMRTNTLFQQGILNFSGDNTFTGGFVLFGGAVVFSHPRAAGRGLFTIGNQTYTGGTIYLIPGINLSGANAITNQVLIARDFTVSGTNPLEFAGPVVLITNAVQRSINVTNPAGLVISGPVSGYGFNKVGQGLLTFNGVCSQDGPSTISVGPMAIGPGGEFTGATTILVGGGASLDVSAVPVFAVKTNQAMRADGGCKISGDVTIYGVLTNLTTSAATFSNRLTLAAGSTTAITIYPSVQPRTNFICLGNLSFGGHLIVTSFGTALQAGDTFKLFDFSGSPGSFDSMTLPTLDAGLDWDTSTLSVDGKIKVISTASPQPQLSQPFLLDPTHFVLTASGGTPNGQFRVLTQTNMAEPPANWDPISTNTFDGSGGLLVTNLVNLDEPQRFFLIVEP